MTIKVEVNGATLQALARVAIISNAPPCPDWFEPNMKTLKPEQVDIREYISDDDLRRRVLNEHFDDAVDEAIPQPVKTFWEARAKTDEARRQWDAERQRERVLQWPIYYANQVLKRALGPAPFAAVKHVANNMP